MRSLGLAVALSASIAMVSAASAAIGDFRTGSFSGYWCSYDARFDIQSRDGNTWVFHGRLFLSATNQYDELWVEQYSDNSLRIIRYLSGQYQGQTQVIQTFSPEQVIIGGVVMSAFSASSTAGPGCPSDTTTWIRIPE